MRIESVPPTHASPRAELAGAVPFVAFVEGILATRSGTDGLRLHTDRTHQKMMRGGRLLSPSSLFGRRLSTSRKGRKPEKELTFGGVDGEGHPTPISVEITEETGLPRKILVTNGNSNVTYAYLFWMIFVYNIIAFNLCR